MDPHHVFCPNLDCPARGQPQRGNLTVHSQAEQRFCCSLCGQTFSLRKGTCFYRRRVAPAGIPQGLTLIAHGCPIPAIVAAFGFQARTVRSGVAAAGFHCQRLHQQRVLPQELGQVQADELRVKLQGQIVWLAQAIAVPSRLWLGAVLGGHRDEALLKALVAQVCAWLAPGPLRVAIDGLAGYVRCFRRGLRSPQRNGRVGRPRLIPWAGIVIGQVIKRRQRRRVVAVIRRLALGTVGQLQSLVADTQGGGELNTAYIERLNATFRERLALLARRTRRLGRERPLLQAAVYLIGCVYNFCCEHQSLSCGSGGATPAMLAGLTDHCWTVDELLWDRVPPPPWRPPKRRGRPSKREQELVQCWAS
jgi:transposase-like protein